MGILDKVTALLPRHHPRASEQNIPGGRALALRDDLDRWFHRFVDEPWSFVPDATERFEPAVDVRETPTTVSVTAEVPGLEPEDVQLSVVNRNLVIRGEKRDAFDETRDDVHVSELRYGSFVRSIPLPSNADPDKAEAQMKKGVLTVTFPKRTEGAGRIPVRT